MNPNQKSTKEAAPAASAEKFEAAAAGFPVAVATLCSKGVARFVEVQKTVLDLAAQQNAEVLDACKKALHGMPPVPGAFLLDMAGQAFDKCIEAQKAVLDQFVEQNSTLLDYSKQRTDNVSKATATFTHIVQESVERGIAVQKTVLDFAAQQNRAVCDTMKRQAGVSGTPAAAAAESMVRGVDALIETQKELMDIATKPLKVAAKA